MFSLEKFAERLLNLMVEHGDTTYSLADSVGMSAAATSRYSRGLLTPRASADKKNRPEVQSGRFSVKKEVRMKL